MTDTQIAVGDLITHDLGATDTPLVDAGETVPFLVTEYNPETGTYAGYAFLPGGAGMPYIAVDPNAPEPTSEPVTTGTPSMSDLVNFAKNDPEFMDYLAWKDSQVPAPADPPIPPPSTDPAPVTTPSTPTDPSNPTTGDLTPASTDTATTGSGSTDPQGVSQ